MTNIYPMVSRKEDVGLDVYYRLKATNMNYFDMRKKESSDAEQVSGITSIPYLQDAKCALQNMSFKSMQDGKRILIVADRMMIAEKVALYLERYFSKLEEEEAKEEDQFLFLQKLGLASDFSEDEELTIENMENAELAVWNLNVKTESNKEPGNIYIRILQKGGPAVDEAVLFTGVGEGEDVRDKIDAIKAVRLGNTYIHITKEQLDAPWVMDLEICNGYELVYINPTPARYYLDICSDILDEYGYRIEEESGIEWLVNFVMRKRGSDFREEDLQWFIERAIAQSKKRGEGKNVLCKEDFSPVGKREKSALDVIEGMPGLNKPKKMIKEMLALCKEEARNEKLKGMHRNMIFAGNPGTAKTTMAMLTGQMMAECGVSNGNFVVAARADLIGEYVGKTAIKTKKVFEEARGGVLFIDEAAFLLNRDAGGFVQECIKEIVRFMEVYPDVMVIMACYASEVERLLTLDDGLASRFSRVIQFEDYSSEVLMEIADYMFEEKGYEWDKKEALPHLKNYLARLKASKHFGNAREVRKVVEQAIVKHAVSMLEEKESRAEFITGRDIKEAIDEFDIKSETEHKTIGFAWNTDSKSARQAV